MNRDKPPSDVCYAKWQVSFVLVCVLQIVLHTPIQMRLVTSRSIHRMGAHHVAEHTSDGGYTSIIYYNILVICIKGNRMFMLYVYMDNGSLMYTYTFPFLSIYTLKFGIYIYIYYAATVKYIYIYQNARTRTNDSTGLLACGTYVEK